MSPRLYDDHGVNDALGNPIISRVESAIAAGRDGGVTPTARRCIAPWCIEPVTALWWARMGELCNRHYGRLPEDPGGPRTRLWTLARVGVKVQSDEWHAARLEAVAWLLRRWELMAELEIRAAIARELALHGHAEILPEDILRWAGEPGDLEPGEGSLWVEAMQLRVVVRLKPAAS